ncbi:MAG TPA: nitroreductase family deazaflavin-dependent oxidoreductase [Acidimicrobiia bacterium]|jgi:deazaflavin-dependent oxidoreductase (nitroreductase family)
MALDGTYAPSPWAPIADQVKLYEESGGTDGTTLEGQPCIILWTKGRHSGEVRKTPLMRVNDGDRYAVVASLGGAPKHPVWYLNLVADPHVSLQDGPNLRDYTARVADGDERAEWWKKATAVWPSYDEYQTKTDRTIPVVVLDPA